MTETKALNSPPESQNDESDGSTTNAANQDGGTSEEANNLTTCKDKGEPQISTERGLFYTDEEGSNDTNDLCRFSDSDFLEKDGSTSSDYIFKDTTEDKIKKYQKMIHFDNNISSDEETDYVMPQMASNDGDEPSQANDAFVATGEEEQDSSSSDETALITFAPYFGKIEEIDQSFSNDVMTYIPTYQQKTFNDGGECSKTKDIDAGPSEEKNLCFYDEGANTLATLGSSNQIEVARAGPSNVAEAQIKPRNVAKTHVNYTVPYKKRKKN